MLNTLLYFAPVIMNGITYTVDRIVITFYLIDSLIQKLEENESCLNDLGFRAQFMHSNRIPYKYRFCYRITYKNGCTMTILIRHNSWDKNKCCIELNPNKCFQDEQCITDILYFLGNSVMYWISKIDITVDIPKSREIVTMMKDRRSMLSFFTGKENGTEYLGKKRNAVGRVKLYDKAKESKLTSPLTRVEITLGNPANTKWQDTMTKKLPSIYIKKPQSKVDISNEKLNETERVLIDLLNDCRMKLEMWRRLGYKMRKKVEPYVFYNEEEFVFDNDAITAIAYRMLDIITLDGTIISNGKFIKTDVTTKN